MVKVIHEIEKCIGCGTCAALCEEYWEMDGDKSKLKGGKKNAEGNFERDIKNAGCNKEAAESCPVNCIKIE